MQADTAAQTQSAPQVSPTQQTSYVAQSSAQAPAVATSPQWVAPQAQQVAPAPQVQAQMGVTGYQSSPTAFSPQAPMGTPQAENPYKDAFNRVVGLLSSPVQFPFQGQQSQTSPVLDQGNYGYPQTTQYSSLGQQTYTPSINSSQEYYDDYSQVSSEISEEALLDAGVSETSLEVIDHFGADAPAILNDYACQIEDSLILTNNQLSEAVGLLQEMSEEHKAYEQILTDPDVLADYTCEFFGPEGPYPVDEDGYGYDYEYEADYGDPQFAGQAPLRPEMPMPPTPQAPADAEDFWENFGGAADRDPQNAWRYLNAAQQNPDVFRQKLLVME
tara:strand:+ start:128 stop:1117 length:990 start_codon:yes stop_codon:yes gene_type:complete